VTIPVLDTYRNSMFGYGINLDSNTQESLINVVTDTVTNPSSWSA
jgi:hypothetical protein